MLYCPECQRLVRPEELSDPQNPVAGCPECQSDLRPVEDTDPVLLLLADAMHTNLVAPLLEDNRIPFTAQGEQGIGFTMSAGNLLEVYRFYVPYGMYTQARETILSVFADDAHVMEGLLDAL